MESYHVGQWVTILNSLRNPNDRSWCGAPLKVVDIDFPYFVMQEYRNGAPLFGPFSIDLRQYELKALSAEYVDALVGEEKQRRAS